jgi:hypothetical protein
MMEVANNPLIAVSGLLAVFASIFAPPPDESQDSITLLIGSPTTQEGFLFLLRW